MTQLSANLCPEFDPDKNAFSVVQVQGRHRLSDACEWREYGPSAEIAIAVQEEFDRLLSSDPVLADIVCALSQRRCKAVVIGGWQAHTGTRTNFESDDEKIEVHVHPRLSYICSRSR